MSSAYGENLKLSIFGQSHATAVGMVLDGIPAGLPVDMAQLQRFLDRRAPGRAAYSTPRREADVPEFLGGLSDGHTCGAPIAAVIRNENTRSDDYAALRMRPRPGHADYTAQIKYGGYQDAAGGGHFSGRLTAPLCVAGGLCLQWLARIGVRVGAHILRIADVTDTAFDPISPAVSAVSADFPTLSADAAARMLQRIEQAHTEADSVGGVIECAAVGVPVGLGEPMFGGVENRLAQILYGIPAVKGVQFGAGFDVALLRGSRCNDAFVAENGRIRTLTNHCGGILGGITNGMPLLFSVAVKPTPSIAVAQQTVDLTDATECTIRVPGRHDPCIVPRAVAVVEAAAAIALFDLLLGDHRFSGGIGHAAE